MVASQLSFGLLDVVMYFPASARDPAQFDCRFGLAASAIARSTSARVSPETRQGLLENPLSAGFPRSRESRVPILALVLPLLSPPASALCAPGSKDLPLTAWQRLLSRGAADSLPERF